MTIPRTSSPDDAAQPAPAVAPKPLAEQPSEPAARVIGLVKRYGAVTAVDGISFEVERGEIFGLLGPNGAGKTTTIEILEGLRDPDAGEAQVLGLDVRRQRQAIKERIGVQLQTPSLFPRLRVAELLRLFSTFFDHSVPIDRLIAAFGLEESRDKLVRQLSGGQQQRLSVALALVNDPELVFLDEPTNGLDPQARLNLWTVVRGLKQEGKTFLVTTHYMEEAERLCDRVAIIDQGRIVAIGSPRELIRQSFTESAVMFHSDGVDEATMQGLPAVSAARGEAGEWTLFSEDVPATMAGLLAYAERHGITLDGLSVRGATLEDVFLKLTGRRLRDRAWSG